MTAPDRLPAGGADPVGVRVAVDLLGGDHPAGTVVDGALAALAERPGLRVILVGPPDAEPRPGSGLGDRLSLVPATECVDMAEDPARAVRAKRGASVRVAARLVRDGAADAMVTVGSTGAAMAAALFTLGRLPGTTRPALAVVVPALRHPVVLLDAGANPDVTADVLAQWALSGAAYARGRLAVERPRVGLLSIGAEAGKGDGLRKQAHAAVAAALAGLPVEFVGNVEGGDVPLGGRADVVVTDGFTGNVLLKGLEGAYRLVVGRLQAALAAAAAAGRPTDAVGPALDELLGGTGGPLRPELLGGAVLLGVRGVVVVGHGASSPTTVAACVLAAADAVRDGLVGRVQTGLSELVARRRAAAGLAARPGRTG